MRAKPIYKEEPVHWRETSLIAAAGVMKGIKETAVVVIDPDRDLFEPSHARQRGHLHRQFRAGAEQARKDESSCGISV